MTPEGELDYNIMKSNVLRQVQILTPPLTSHNISGPQFPYLWSGDKIPLGLSERTPAKCLAQRCHTVSAQYSGDGTAVTEAACLVHLHTVGLWEPTTSSKLGQQPVLQVDDRLSNLFILREEVIVVESDLQVLLQRQSAGQLEHPAGVGADVRTTPAP